MEKNNQTAIIVTLKQTKSSRKISNMPSYLLNDGTARTCGHAAGTAQTPGYAQLRLLLAGLLLRVPLGVDGSLLHCDLVLAAHGAGVGVGGGVVLQVARGLPQVSQPENISSI